MNEIDVRHADFRRIDLNLRPALWPQGEDPTPRLWLALAEADLVKLSREELEYLARPLGGEEAVLQRLWQHRAQLLVVTDGAGPIAWHTRAASGTVETFQVTTLCDHSMKRIISAPSMC